MLSNSVIKIQGGGLGKSDRKEGNEMALFESLMSSTTTSNVEDSEVWGMSLFDNAEDENTYTKEVEESNPVTRIDASKKKKSLKKAMDDMKLDKRPPTAAAPGGEKKKKTKGESVLNMFDEAVARPATAKTKVKRSESAGSSTTTTKPRTRSGSRPGTSSRPGTNASERATSAAGPKRAASAKKRTTEKKTE